MTTKRNYLVRDYWDDLPEGIQRLVCSDAVVSKTDHLAVLLRLWLLETGFEVDETSDNSFFNMNKHDKSSRIEMKFILYGCSLRLHMVPMVETLISVRGYLAVQGRPSINLILKGCINNGEVVTKTTGLRRFSRTAVSSLRIRFKNEICLAAKRTVCNELGLAHGPDSIQALPTEMVLKIANYLGAKDTSSFAKVNRRTESILNPS